MADEVYPHAARPLVVQVTVETQGSQVALEFSTQQGRGLAAAGITGLLAAHENQVFVGTWAGGEGGCGGRSWDGRRG